MKIINFNSYIPDNTVLTTGNFDGVHLGHRKIISNLKKTASEKNCSTALLTFSNHPRTYFDPEQKHQLLTTYEEKIALIAEAVDYIISVYFDKSIADITPEKFMAHLQHHFNMTHYIAGHDHHIGSSQSGNFTHLQAIAEKLNFSIHRIGPYVVGGDPVSSTRIKQSLSDGNVESARQMLGCRYMISGQVVHGLMKGRSIGYPTANIETHQDKVIPARGVYAVSVTVNSETFMGMLNIGYNPTLSSLKDLSTEVHILDFDRNIYGQTISVEFYKRVRDERFFSSKEELIHQLNGDKQKIRDYFNGVFP